MKRLLTVVLSAALMVAPSFASEKLEHHWQALNEVAFVDCVQADFIQPTDKIGQSVAQFIFARVNSTEHIKELKPDEVSKYLDIKKEYLIWRDYNQAELCSTFYDGLDLKARGHFKYSK